MDRSNSSIIFFINFVLIVAEKIDNDISAWLIPIPGGDSGGGAFATPEEPPHLVRFRREEKASLECLEGLATGRRVFVG